MYVEKISLKNYRNLETTTIELGSGINIFHGNNAQGKTNFLESIYLCATGRSQRAHYDRELIQFNENESYIQLYVTDETITDKISMHIKKDGKKGIAVNGIPLKKLGDLFGILLVVIFSPEDLQIVKSGPGERRKFMDMELCQLSKVYYHELGSYYRILKQRNNLLKEIQKNRSLCDTLFVWDEQLITHGKKIIEFRQDFVEKINGISSGIYSSITDGKENFQLSYKPNVTAEDFQSKISKNIDRDIFMGTTGTGIHKDDILMTIDQMDVRNYGSQGQQRSASLSMKLAEIHLIKDITDRVPVLLLDDVLSELDENRQRFLLSHLQDIQTVITCTGVEDILKKLVQYKNLNVFNVHNGTITKEML